MLRHLFEQQDSGGEDDSPLTFGCDDGEADDEQSDWHESAPAAPGTVYILTDDEDSTDMPMSLFANEGEKLRMHNKFLPFYFDPFLNYLLCDKGTTCHIFYLVTQLKIFFEILRVGFELAVPV